MKASLIIVGFFVLGIVSGVFHVLPEGWVTDEACMGLLLALMLAIGIGMGSGDRLRAILRSLSPRLLLFPLATTAGTFLGAAACALLEARLPAAGRNYIRMVRLEGSFAAMTVRSELGQEPPYRPLAEMMAADERVFSYGDVTGTLVGLCCPPFLGGGLNTPGWHFHFLSADRTRGGHVLALSMLSARLTWCHLKRFRLILPETPTFTGMDLGESLSF